MIEPRPTFKPHEYKLTRRDRRKLKKYALSGIYGTATMNIVELLDALNNYSTWHKEYKNEQRAVDKQDGNS